MDPLDSEVHHFLKNGDYQQSRDIFPGLGAVGSLQDAALISGRQQSPGESKPVPYTLCRLTHKRRRLLHPFIVSLSADASAEK
jgi:hypothetical protein